MTFSLHNIWLPAIDCNYLAKTITISNGSYQYIGQENIPGKLPALDSTSSRPLKAGYARITLNGDMTSIAAMNLNALLKN